MVYFTGLKESLKDFKDTNNQAAFGFNSFPVTQSVALPLLLKVKLAHCLN